MTETKTPREMERNCAPQNRWITQTMGARKLFNALELVVFTAFGVVITVPLVVVVVVIKVVKEIVNKCQRRLMPSDPTRETRKADESSK